MKTIQSIVNALKIEELASRSNLRYGQHIVKTGAVTVDFSNVFHAVVSVQYSGGENRTVDFYSTPKGLRWKCTCTGKKNYFCNHCAAAALAIQQP